MLATYNTNPRFSDELSRSNVNVIDKIRYRYDANNVGWIDVHYAASNSNDVWMTFDVGSYSTIQKYWVAQNFTAVDDAPSTGGTADTIMSEYEFSNACYNGIMYVTTTVTTTSGGYVNLTDYPKSKYMILGAETTSVSDSFVRITGASTNNWIRILSPDGTPVASQTVSVRFAFLKL